MTFYVYHKVKGDRLEGPSYDLLDTFDERDKADQFANEYNTKRGYTKGQGFHLAVVRTRKVQNAE
jgi:hypothetical protein